ncbi:hypothetical protein JJB09_25400 [Rhizobium sp. KVB221]|uniref:Uncharacterized protein n=1 Tax=Rhizobium setariae TaxID=2801340 RepID=A0A936YUG3_9HYPH|nr:hypothetical protein [Rhizobium setariae]MBL0375356.1 hypothetical protein [Rhizobium setariae]
MEHEITWQTLVDVWGASVDYLTKLYAAKWALQKMDPIPLDIGNNVYWPK